MAPSDKSATEAVDMQESADLGDFLQMSHTDRRIDHKIGLLFQHIARLRNRYFDTLVAAHDLTSAQVRVINLLLRQQGMSQVELARILGIGTVAVSAQLDRMEKNGWVTRKPDLNDRRSKRVWLTDAGLAKKKLLTDSFAQLNDVAFDGLTEHEIDTLVTGLRRVRQNLETALKE